MNKTVLTKPVLICLHGFPGSGKSYVARNLATALPLAHVSADRIRSELFRQPRYDAQENAVVLHLMNYMTEEFLNAGVSVVYDINAARTGQRRALRELARRHHAEYLLVWLQIDQESSFARTQNRDRRTTDDHYAQDHTEATFSGAVDSMQSPHDEEYLVISGKHAFITQKNAIINRLYQRKLIGEDVVRSNVAKPELINLIPNPFTAQSEQRNIEVR